MEVVQKYLLVVLVVIVGFWYFGGFTLLNFFRIKRLKQQIKDPLDTPELKLLREQLAATQKITMQHSFKVYAIQQKIIHTDRWPKVAYEHDQHNPVAAYFYAAFLLREAWAIRGTGSAKSLSAETVERFRNKLIEAETILLQRLDLSQNVADGVFLILDVYLALGQREKAELILEKHAHSLKGRLDVAVKELKMLYPRWGGSHEKLQAAANHYGLQAGSMIAAKAFAYCHFIEDEEESTVSAWLKTKPLDDLLREYKHLPKAPSQIASYEDYNLLLAHKLFARLFFYTNNKSVLKQAIINTSGNFAVDEAINPNSQNEITFIKQAQESGVTSFA